MIAKGKIELDARDWLTDLALAGCPLADQGALVRIMALASMGKPYGFLAEGQERLTDAQVAAGLQLTVPEWREIRQRLLDTRRIRQDGAHGALYVPRMVKDSAIRKASREGGKSGGNPNIVEKAPAATTRITFGYIWRRMPEHLDREGVRKAWTAYYELRRRARKPFTTAAVERLIEALTPLGAKAAEAWVWCAHDKGWSGFYPPPANYGNGHKKAELETDPEVLNYAAQYVALMGEDNRKAEDLPRFQAKVADALGSGGWQRMIKAIGQQKARRE